MTKSPRKRWLAFGLVAGFLAIAIMARYNPTWAGQVKDDPKGPAAEDTGKAKKKVAPVANLKVPGAGQKLDATALARIIDQEIQHKLDAEKVKASPLASDAEFLRRVYLDVVGVVPTPEKVKAFLESKDPRKRAKVIDELLADPRFGSALAEVWSGLMIPREPANAQLKSDPLTKWLAENFNSGKPLDKIVYELLTATGKQDENGAVTYFAANETVDKMTGTVTRMFLGVQLECAQCHNHPFTDWKQTEYWAMAAFFMKTRVTAAKRSVEEAEKGTKGELPERAKIVPAKFLQAESPKLNPSEPYRPVLAKWIASPTNPFFAPAMVNRTWYQLFGRGIVNAVDNMHEDNAATHPELLAALAEQFKGSAFDLKYLYRAILNSETYQRSSKPQGNSDYAKEYYSHSIPRVLSAEQLHDSLETVTGKKVVIIQGVVAKQGPGPRNDFIKFFKLRADEGADPLEYQQGIPQALRLMNTAELTTSSEAVANAMKTGGGDHAKVIEQLYLVALARLPSSKELERMVAYVTAPKRSDLRAAYGDVLWAMLNSSEFAYNH